MKWINCSILFYSVVFTLHAQRDYRLDYYRDTRWPFGYSFDVPETNFDQFLIRFEKDAVRIDSINTSISFSRNALVFSSDEDSLIFITNGYLVRDKYDQVIPGLPSNLPVSFQDGLGVALDAYLVQGAVLLLPDPAGKNDSYLFFIPNSYRDSFPAFFDHSLSYVSVKERKGTLVGSSPVEIAPDDLNTGRLTAVRHGNGRDWWLIVWKLKTNAYSRILVSPAGVQLLSWEKTGPVPELGQVGQSAFSPDGRWYAQVHSGSAQSPASPNRDKVYLYNVDRCTGYLTFYQEIKQPYDYDTEFNRLSIAFSPNSQYLYTNGRLTLWQYDLTAGDIAASREVLGIYDGFESPPTFAASFNLLALAPDGRLYMNTRNGTDVMHVVNYPDEKGEAAQFCQHCLTLPVYNAFSLPNNPHCRLGPADESPCDTLGLDHWPRAGFRYAIDAWESLKVRFTDNSYYGVTQYAWSFGDGKNSQEEHPWHLFPSAGTYEVCQIVSNAYGADTLCKTIVLDGLVAENPAPKPSSEMTLFPNPVHDQMDVLIAPAPQHPGTITILNAMGISVWEGKWPAGERHQLLDWSALPSAAYLLKVQFPGHPALMRKVVKS